MRLQGVKTTKKFLRWLRARTLGGALILGYHRISNLEADFYEVGVSPEKFAEQMEALRQYARPISLSKLVWSLKHNNALPPKAVAITFDDGYADNLYVAKPILEKYDIPATVFVCTGYAGQVFWWDELIRIAASPQTKSGALCFEVGRMQFVWDRPQGRHVSDADVRREFHRTLYHFLLTLDAEDQYNAMNILRKWSGISSSEIAARALTHDELVQIADDGLIEIGAHTQHHLMLPGLPLGRQKEEIISSKQELETLLGKSVDGFAYPNGRATDDTKRIVREAGFGFACTSLHDVVRSASDLYELTRFWQRNVDGDRFLRGLSLWM